MFIGIVDSYKSGTHDENGKIPNLKKKAKHKHKTPTKLPNSKSEKFNCMLCKLVIIKDMFEKNKDPRVAANKRTEPNNKKNVDKMLNIEYFKAPSNDLYRIILCKTVK